MSSGSAGAPARILFVDDEPRILLSLKAMFRGTYDVVTAEGGAAAIEQIKTQKFDVIVSDQRMPGVTGVEVLRTAREMQPRAIRLLLTGYSDLSAIIGSINEGEIFRFISKPWSNAELRAILAAAVDAAKVEPVLAAPEPVAAAGMATDAAGKPGVMLLDDDTASRATLKRALETDYSVYEAGSVKDCMDLLGAHPIGVIITELVIGGEMLTDLLVALRQSHPALVIVVLTAHADAGHSITLINKGQIYRLLIKPVSDSVLRGTVAIAERRFEMLVHHPEQIRRISVDEKSLLDQSPERVGLFAKLKQVLQSQ